MYKSKKQHFSHQNTMGVIFLKNKKSPLDIETLPLGLHPIYNYIIVIIMK